MNFFIKPEESAECHQTLSSQVGSGRETKVTQERIYWGGTGGHRAERQGRVAREHCTTGW